MPFDNHLTSECKRCDHWSACISLHRAASKWEIDGRAFTKFTIFTTSLLRLQLWFKVTWCWSFSVNDMMYKIYMGTNLLCFSLKAFLVPVRASLPSVQMLTQSSQGTSWPVRQSFTALNKLITPCPLCENGRQNIKLCMHVYTHTRTQIHVFFNWDRTILMITLLKSINTFLSLSQQILVKILHKWIF